MNYRHAFHAGNHGDVLKHAVLARVLSHLKRKETGFAVLDAHAGIGLYDLASLEAIKTGEWRGGIGALLQAKLPGDVARLLAPYLVAVKACNASGDLQHYPGSPEIMRQMLRPQDRLALNELHPQDYATLAGRYGHDYRVRLSQVDAGQAVKAALPFVERRGLLLLDPAYEVSDEPGLVARMVSHALRRMAQLCIMVWYPVTTQAFANGLTAGLPLENAKGALRAEVLVRKPVDGGGLAGSGLVIINPPWTLHDDLQTVLPALARVVGEGGRGSWRLDWLKQPA
jgi:23S rRNA (adenine2030-N6)-methyltransferase